MKTTIEIEHETKEELIGWIMDIAAKLKNLAIKDEVLENDVIAFHDHNCAGNYSVEITSGE